MPAIASTPNISYSDGYADVRGIRLHYVDYGGDGEVLVALPGLRQNARAFDAIAPILVPHVHLIALDLRGRGESAWGPPEQYGWRHYMVDLQGVLSALDLTRYALIGTSLGGLLALMQAIVHPDRVTRLVLNDVALSLNFGGLLMGLEHNARTPPVFASIGEAIAWFKADRVGLDCLDEQSLTSWVQHYLTPCNGGLRVNCDPAIMDPTVMQATIGLGLPWAPGARGWEQARRLTMPLLILRGGRSEVLLAEDADALARWVPHGAWVEVPGAGHAPTLYEPTALDALRAFFVPSLTETA